MRVSNTDLFNPRTEMDSHYSRGAPSEGDFGFAFNDSNFTDQVLRIKIMDKSPGEGFTSIADWASHRKRRREYIKKDNGTQMGKCCRVMTSLPRESCIGNVA